MEPGNPGDKPQRLVRQAGTFFLPANGGQLQAPRDERYQAVSPQNSEEVITIFSQAWLPSSFPSSTLSTFIAATAVRRFRSSCEMGSFQDLLAPQALPGLVLSPTADLTPSQAARCSSSLLHPPGSGQQTQHTRKSVPGEQGTPRHFAAASGGSGGAPTQREVHPTHFPTEVTKLCLTKPARLLTECFATLTPTLPVASVPSIHATHNGGPAPSAPAWQDQSQVT